MEYRKETLIDGRITTRRLDRQWNIAVKFLDMYPKFQGTAVNASRFRDVILKEIGIDNYKMTKDYREGDYKANGDAMGGHGLHLERRKGTSGTELLFSQINKDILEKFVKNNQRSNNFRLIPI